MEFLLRKLLFPVFCILAFNSLSGSPAKADDWGCQVILCISNPGGPSQFAECRPPIEKLWRELAKGHSFPTCSGVGFRSSRPGYEPYYCNYGYKLVGSYGPHGQEGTCVSKSLKKVESTLCSFSRDDYGGNTGSVVSPHWQRVDGHSECMAYPIARPNIREQPHYIDITIDGSGAQRVWY